jgi:hypothetical protein
VSSEREQQNHRAYCTVHHERQAVWAQNDERCTTTTTIKGKYDNATPRHSRLGLVAETSVIDDEASYDER